VGASQRRLRDFETIVAGAFAALPVGLFWAANGHSRWDNFHGGILFLFLVLPGVALACAGLVMGLQATDSNRLLNCIGMAINLGVLAVALRSGGISFVVDIARWIASLV
jgi:hypothetical protein